MEGEGGGVFEGGGAVSGRKEKEEGSVFRAVIKVYVMRHG